VCILQIWSFEKLKFKVQSSFSLFSLSKFCSPLSLSFHLLLLPSSSDPWLPIVVSLFLTHLLLEVSSPITFTPSTLSFHWSSRSKGHHWCRRSKAYKLYIELHYVVWEHLHLDDVLLHPLSFVQSIHFHSLFFIVFYMYLLHCLVVWCYLE